MMKCRSVFILFLVGSWPHLLQAEHAKSLTENTNPSNNMALVEQSSSKWKVAFIHSKAEGDAWWKWGKSIADRLSACGLEVEDLDFHKMKADQTELDRISKSPNTFFLVTGVHGNRTNQNSPTKYQWMNGGEAIHAAEAMKQIRKSAAEAPVFVDSCNSGTCMVLPGCRPGMACTANEDSWIHNVVSPFVADLVCDASSSCKLFNEIDGVSGTKDGIVDGEEINLWLSRKESAQLKKPFFSHSGGLDLRENTFIIADQFHSELKDFSDAINTFRERKYEFEWYAEAGFKGEQEYATGTGGFFKSNFYLREKKMKGSDVLDPKSFFDPVSPEGIKSSVIEGPVRTAILYLQKYVTKEKELKTTFEEKDGRLSYKITADAIVYASGSVDTSELKFKRGWFSKISSNEVGVTLRGEKHPQSAFFPKEFKLTCLANTNR